MLQYTIKTPLQPENVALLSCGASFCGEILPQQLLLLLLLQRKIECWL